MGRTKSQTNSSGNPAKTAEKPAQFISTAKAAERLDISPNMLRGLIYDGKIKAIQIGRLIRVDTASLDEFIAESTFSA